MKLTVLRLSQHQLLSQDRTGTGRVQGGGSRGETEAEFASSVEFYDLVFFEVGSVTKSQQYGTPFLVGDPKGHSYRNEFTTRK